MVCGRARAAVLSGLLALLMSATGHAQGPVSDLPGVSGPAASAAAESPAAQASLGPTKAIGPEEGHNRGTPSGHPLWRLPLGELSVTRERPIFSATRRPPPATGAPPPPV